MRTYWTRLRRLIHAHFSLEELRTICFDLNIPHEDFPDKGKEAFSRELVVYVQRYRIENELSEVLNHRRPNVSWPKLDEIDRSSSSTSPSGPSNISANYALPSPRESVAVEDVEAHPNDNSTFLQRITPVNRTREISMFREMVLRGNRARGLIVHSQGSGGWGKSILLQMFRKEALNMVDPSTVVFEFDPSAKESTWIGIMKQTAQAIGIEHFQQFLSTYISSGYAADTDDESGNFTRSPEDNAKLDPSQNQQDWAHWSMTIHQESISIEMFQRRATDIFFRELANQRKCPLIIWLVDHIEWIDLDTRKWLISIFGRIETQQLDNVILIVAGRNSLYDHPSWGNRVMQLDVCNFEHSAILDLMILTNWVSTIDDNNKKLCHEIANSLMEKTRGNPLEICSSLQRGRPGWDM